MNRHRDAIACGTASHRATLREAMKVQASAKRTIPIAPTEEQWRAMTPAERDRFLDNVLDALSDPQQLMSEGRPHKKAKTRALDLLGLHFRTLGRVIYLQEEMAVLYPGEESFSPDILAVVGVEEPEDDERMAWVVVDEGKGLDFVLEVTYHGDRSKDLVDNVERYARLGIPEYFVYDRARQRIWGYRLPSAGAKRYQPIIPQGGRYASMVLGLDLAIHGNRLRFFQGMAELFDSANLIDQLSTMVDNLEAKTRLAEATIEEATAQAQQATTQAQQATAQAQQATAGLRDAILLVLELRGIVCPDEVRARLSSCDDPDSLRRCLSHAKTCSSADELFRPTLHGA
jgi:Uma2 family endonuclease